ncbi:OLC1v1005040C1 [Oldenlandia corymbosa var. corymbosa]|uniref:OLC1v1005040C1 n=1 Tax=Oldenlandia corymbosa var. corymbosa TaxID=529605 RepID=A0AAV1DGN4_OLDCO|nr:OLC1v1005040C1 [Oldenlandia corymbosa var. corymbosa]
MGGNQPSNDAQSLKEVIEVDPNLTLSTVAQPLKNLSQEGVADEAAQNLAEDAADERGSAEIIAHQSTSSHPSSSIDGQPQKIDATYQTLFVIAVTNQQLSPEKQASEEVAAAAENSPSVIRRINDLSSPKDNQRSSSSTAEEIWRTPLISLPQNPAISDGNHSCRNPATSASSTQQTPSNRIV